jgi:hypothetical protein
VEVGYEVVRFPMSIDMYVYVYIYIYRCIYKSGVVVLEFGWGGLQNRALGEP